MESDSIRVFEAFAGIGTQHMALKRLGIDFQVVAISEVDENALKTYQEIHGRANNLGDIRTIAYEDVPDHDLFTYSFPCQNISKEGDLKGISKDSDSNSSLLWKALGIVERKKPKYLLGENVKNLLSYRFEKDFKEMMKFLDGIGYNTYVKVINALGHVPQNRERVLIVSIRKDVDDGTFAFKERPATTKVPLDYLEKNPDDRYFVTDYVHEQLVLLEEEDSVRIKNATKLGYLVAEHGDGISIGYPGSKTRRGRVQKRRIQTLTTVPLVGVLLKTENGFRIRLLTPFEAWRLMDIEDEYFHKAEKVTAEYLLYHQAGNAIVVGVLEDIFRTLLVKEKEGN